MLNNCCHTELAKYLPGELRVTELKRQREELRITNELRVAGWELRVMMHSFNRSSITAVILSLQSTSREMLRVAELKRRGEELRMTNYEYGISNVDQVDG